MEYSRAGVGQMSLDDFVGVVASIYSAHDCHRSIWDVWCHTLHHAAGIVEQIRIGDHNELRKEIADFSLWLFTAVLKLSGDLGVPKDGSETLQTSLIRIRSTCSDLLWRKYPNLCPSCSAQRAAADMKENASADLLKCECRAHEARAKNKETRAADLRTVREHSVRVIAEKPASIDQWQKMFEGIFGKSLSTTTLTEIVLHLLEELGEASDAMVRVYSYTRDNFLAGEPNKRLLTLESQLADVFSWLFSIVVKLDLSERDSKNNPITLSGIIWDRYGCNELHAFYCATCKNTRCSCPLVFVSDTHPIEELLSKYP